MFRIDLASPASPSIRYTYRDYSSAHTLASRLGLRVARWFVPTREQHADGEVFTAEVTPLEESERQVLALVKSTVQSFHTKHGRAPADEDALWIEDTWTQSGFGRPDADPEHQLNFQLKNLYFSSIPTPDGLTLGDLQPAPRPPAAKAPKTSAPPAPAAASPAPEPKPEPKPAPKPAAPVAAAAPPPAPAAPPPAPPAAAPAPSAPIALPASSVLGTPSAPAATPAPAPAVAPPTPPPAPRPRAPRKPAAPPAPAPAVAPPAPAAIPPAPPAPSPTPAAPTASAEPPLPALAPVKRVEVSALKAFEPLLRKAFPKTDAPSAQAAMVFEDFVPEADGLPGAVLARLTLVLKPEVAPPPGTTRWTQEVVVARASDLDDPKRLGLYVTAWQKAVESLIAGAQGPIWWMPFNLAAPQVLHTGAASADALARAFQQRAAQGRLSG